ncbi:MAG: divalent metal cation transporter [Patescibacteria group bacterium]|nr:divalent metal cation transporter [Patescibacteria group bacterium]MCL5093665.1 divalent metal cation transporter [Patescibacteria group bacterium]
MRSFTLTEVENKFDIPVRQLSYLIRKHIIEPIVEGGKLLVSEAEINKYLALPELVRKKHTISYLKTLGPGVITGVSDDDCSGVATYSMVGSAYGLNFSWLALYLLPMMTAVQETVARIGIVTGKGLSGAIGKHFGRKVLYPLVALLFIANTINIGADIGAMVASLQLLAPFNFYYGAILLTLFMIALEIGFSYHRYAKILKWLTLSLFAYIITGFVIRPDWGMVLKSIVIPHFSLNAGFFAALVAVMGTTISPYLFFWQASEEVEEKKDKGILSEHHKLALDREIKEMRKDTYTGMSLANLVFLFIVITTAFALHNHGILNINTAAEAAAALKPLAGDFAALLFTVGIVGVGLLAVPVLAGSSAYAIAELFKWKEGLSEKYSKAKGFYGVIIWSMVIGMIMNFAGINPIKALYYAAIINGIVSPVLMFFIFKLGNDKKVMGSFKSPRWVNIWGYLATGFMGIAAIILIVFLVFDL